MITVIVLTVTKTPQYPPTPFKNWCYLEAKNLETLRLIRKTWQRQDSADTTSPTDTKRSGPEKYCNQFFCRKRQTWVSKWVRNSNSALFHAQLIFQKSCIHDAFENGSKYVWQEWKGPVWRKKFHHCTITECFLYPEESLICSFWFVCVIFCDYEVHYKSSKVWKQKTDVPSWSKQRGQRACKKQITKTMRSYFMPAAIIPHLGEKGFCRIVTCCNLTDTERNVKKTEGDIHDNRLCLWKLSKSTSVQKPSLRISVKMRRRRGVQETACKETKNQGAIVEIVYLRSTACPLLARWLPGRLQGRWRWPRWWWQQGSWPCRLK